MEHLASKKTKYLIAAKAGGNMGGTATSVVPFITALGAAQAKRQIRGRPVKPNAGAYVIAKYRDGLVSNQQLSSNKLLVRGMEPGQVS